MNFICKLLLSTLLLFFVGCCGEKYCEGTDEKYMFFIPLDLDEGDVFELQNNYDEHLKLYVTERYSLEPYSYSSCCDCGGCYRDFSLILRDNKDKNKSTMSINYSLHPDTETNIVTGNVVLNECSFKFEVYNRDTITFSEPIIKEFLLDNTIYNDVMKLKDDKSLYELYLAKDKGIIQITKSNSDTIWTIKN